MQTCRCLSASPMHFLNGTETRARKTEGMKWWRWVWSVSLPQWIPCLACLSAVSPAITSPGLLPCQLARVFVAPTLAATSRAAETGHIRPASHITRSELFLCTSPHLSHMHTHTHTYTQTNTQTHTHKESPRLLCVQIYTWKRMNAQNNRYRHACILTHTYIDTEITTRTHPHSASMWVVFFKRLVSWGHWPLENYLFTNSSGWRATTDLKYNRWRDIYITVNNMNSQSLSRLRPSSFFARQGWATRGSIISLNLLESALILVEACRLSVSFSLASLKVSTSFLLPFHRLLPAHHLGQLQPIIRFLRRGHTCTAVSPFLPEGKWHVSSTC